MSVIRVELGLIDRLRNWEVWMPRIFRWGNGELHPLGYWQNSPFITATIIWRLIILWPPNTLLQWWFCCNVLTVRHQRWNWLTSCIHV
jgi:hypothetical protein